MYKVRIILDTKEDIIRTILVEDSINLEELHISIARSFGFNGKEMSSFYKTDSKWNQGEEIPLVDISEFGNSVSMSDCILNKTLPEINHKLIYVYDFLRMWTFYIEVIDIYDDFHTDLPKTIMSVGEIPEEAPKKEFIAENPDNEYFDDSHFDDEFDPYGENGLNDY